MYGLCKCVCMYMYYNIFQNIVVQNAFWIIIETLIYFILKQPTITFPLTTNRTKLDKLTNQIVHNLIGFFLSLNMGLTMLKLTCL
jgi:hypothetical protein